MSLTQREKGSRAMTDRILSEDDVDYLEAIVLAPAQHDAMERNFLRVIASHRLLAEMVKQYERKDYGD